MKSRLFTTDCTPSTTLSVRILSHIATLERRQQRIRFFSFAGLTVFAIIALVPALQVAHREVTQSGFDQYFSLLFSDSRIVLSSWKEFSITLLETLPVLGGALVLATILVGLYGLRESYRNFNTYKLSRFTLA